MLTKLKVCSRKLNLNFRSSFGVRCKKTLQLCMIFFCITILLSSCGGEQVTSSSSLFQPGNGFGPARPGAGVGDNWWVTSNRAYFIASSNNLGKQLLHLTLVQTPCGPAIVKIMGDTYKVKNRLDLNLSMDVKTKNGLKINLDMMTGFCQPRGESRFLYLLLQGMRWVNNAK